MHFLYMSGRFSRSARSLARAMAALEGQADLLAGTEVARPSRAKALVLALWTLIHFAGPQRGETFINVNNAFGKVVASGAEQVSKLRFRRRGWWTTWAVVETPDGRTLISVAHTPASWRILRQRRAWRDGCKHWAQLLDQLAAKHGCSRRIVAADWNRNLASERVQAELLAIFGHDYTIAVPDKATHDVRRIDGLLVQGYTVEEAHTLTGRVYRRASDHRPVAFTLTATSAPRPTPSNPPRKESTMSTVDTILKFARGEIGYREGRSGGHWDNREKYAAQVPGLAWVNAGRYPWCAVFVCAIFNKAGVLALVPGGATASVAHIRDAAKQAGQFSEYPAVGAIAIYGTNGDAHTGIVESYDANTITVIEGNTNTDGSPEGNGVYRQTHQRRDPWVYGYAYPAYPEGIDSADPAWARRAPRKPSQTVAPNEQAARNIGKGRSIAETDRPGARRWMRRAQAWLRRQKA